MSATTFVHEAEVRMGMFTLSRMCSGLNAKFDRLIVKVPVALWAPIAVPLLALPRSRQVPKASPLPMSA